MKAFKQVLTLLITLGLYATTASAMVVPKPGCVNLKNSVWTAQATLTPVFKPGPQKILPIKIVINKVKKTHWRNSWIEYDTEGTINGEYLSGNCYDRSLDSVITNVTFTSGDYLLIAKSYTSRDPKTLTATYFSWRAPNSTDYANNDRPMMLTKQ